MQRALDEVHPESGVLFGRSGWAGQQATGITWGGDQASDFWSLRALVAATLTAAASGFSNWSHDVGGYLGKPSGRALPARAPSALGAVRLLHAADAGPRSLRTGGLALRRQHARSYRDYVLLHERLVPYIRAAAATAARCGLPIIRPLCLVDPGPSRLGVADAYLFGPSLWVAPVLEQGATRARVLSPAWRVARLLDRRGRSSGGRGVERPGAAASESPSESGPAPCS